MTDLEKLRSRACSIQRVYRAATVILVLSLTIFMASIVLGVGGGLTLPCFFLTAIAYSFTRFCHLSMQLRLQRAEDDEVLHLLDFEP
jgi:hypothetical protein